MTTHTNVTIAAVVRRFLEVFRRGGRVLSSKFSVPFASVLLWAGVSQAQVAVGPVVGVGYGGWGGVGTAESSAAHGYADVIRSEGYYNMATAEGLIYAEQARAQYLKNNSEAWQAYWAGKEQRSAIDAQRRESSRHSAEALNIAGKFNAPQPLNRDLLNRETGKIVWPRALLDSKYAAKRAELEKLFELRANTSSGSYGQAKIQTASGELASLLKSNITRTSATDYMKARKFLDSLAVSAS
jgi:hypothetical protein